MGALMHILEMDYLHRRSVVHPGSVVIPVVLAVGLPQKMLKETMRILYPLER
jgi:Uncharacterized protein involved in propionate catabolism